MGNGSRIAATDLIKTKRPGQGLNHVTATSGWRVRPFFPATFMADDSVTPSGDQE